MKKNDCLNFIAKFISVGLLATLIHALVYAVTIFLLDTAAQMANFVGYLFAFSFSYIFHIKWTFSHKKTTVSSTSLFRFFLVSFLAFSTNALIVFVVEDVLVINSLYAIFGIMFFTPFLTLILLNYWAFTDKRTLQ